MYKRCGNTNVGNNNKSGFRLLAMKIFSIILLLLILFSKCKGQEDRFFIDRCYKILEKRISDNRIKQKIVDTCLNQSKEIEYSIKDSLFGKPYSCDGQYAEYWDNHFTNIKLRGFYKRIRIGAVICSRPSGIWQEYSPNGKLLSEGACKIVCLQLKCPQGKLNSNCKIALVDDSNLLDTMYLDYNKVTRDSLKTLVVCSDIHQYDIQNSKILQASAFNFDLSFPSASSIKIGEWNYYNENGVLKRKEIYSEGRLLSVNNY